MKSTKSSFSASHLVVAGVLAAMGFAASAQGTGNAPPPPPAQSGAASAPHHPGHPGMFHRDPAQMKKRFEEARAKREAQFRTILQITPAQEGAWSAFTAAMKPPAERPQRMDRKAMENLTTPQRIDVMQKLRADRNAAMERRDNAVKTFYAALSPAQQKTFDVVSAKMMSRHGHRGMHGQQGRGGWGSHDHGPQAGPRGDHGPRN